MKVKAIAQKKLTKKQFFIFMTAPLLIGLFMTLISGAHGTTWDEKAEKNKSPLKQGWSEFKNTTPSENIV